MSERNLGTDITAVRAAYLVVNSTRWLMPIGNTTIQIKPTPTAVQNVNFGVKKGSALFNNENDNTSLGFDRRSIP